MRFKRMILSLLVALLGSSGANALDQNSYWQLKLVRFKFFNSPILGSSTFYFFNENDTKIEVVCSRDIRLQPIMAVRYAPESNTPYAAIMNVESINSCLRKMQPIAEEVRAGAQYTVRLTNPGTDYYQSVDFTKK